jgi:hypothetical protein
MKSKIPATPDRSDEATLDCDLVHLRSVTDDSNFDRLGRLDHFVDDSEIAASDAAKTMQRLRKGLPVLVWMDLQTFNGSGKSLAHGLIEVEPILSGFLKELDLVQGQGLRFTQGMRL